MEERKISGFGIALIVMAIGLLALMLKPEGRVLGLDTDELASLVYLLPILGMLAAGVIASRRTWGQSARNLLIWLLILLALATVSLYREDAKEVGARLLAGLMPGHAVTVTNRKGEKEVLLSRDMSGHFNVTVDVNNQPIPMLVDTGASTVTLTYEDAVAAGIIPENLAYTTRVLTANGEALAAPIHLTLMQLGPITRENVPALVTRRGAMDRSLLGMSFLSSLSSLHMRADELRLKD
jgi:aspartyl protease family protein